MTFDNRGKKGKKIEIWIIPQGEDFMLKGKIIFLQGEEIIFYVSNFWGELV